MLKEAIHHEPYHSYAYPVNDDTLCLKLKAKKGDLEQVSIIYDRRYRNWNINSPRFSVQMKKSSSDKLFDYFTAEIECSSKKFRYYFVLDDGLEQLYYGGDFSSKIPEHSDCFEYSYICEQDYFATPEWVKDAVFYQIFPDSFNSGDRAISPSETTPWGQKQDRSTVYGGDLQGIIDKLDYIEELGIDAIYLTPVFAAETSHKYDTIDYLSIDENFGDLEVTKELVAQAHKRGVKVIFDAVFNHCSNQFFAFQDLLATGQESDYKDWFYVDDFPIKEDPEIDYPLLERLVTELQQVSDLSTDLFKKEILPKFNLSNPRGEEYLIKLVELLFEQDDNFIISIESLRKLSQENEAVEELITPNYETFGITSWNMPKLRTANPEVRDYLLEVARYWIEEVDIDGWRLDVANEVDYQFWREFRKVVKEAKSDAYIVGEVWDDGTPWLNGDQFDGVMNYSFTNAVWDFFCRREINVEAFEDQLCQVRAKYKKPAQLASLNLVDSHDTDRVLTVANNDTTRQKLTLAFQMTYLGPPMIYYGDEVGITGEEFKSCRQSMIWDEEKQDKDLLDWYQKLIGIRQDNPALRTGDFELVIKDAVKNSYAFSRQTEDNKLLIVFNNSNQQAKLNFALEEVGIRTEKLLELISEREYITSDQRLEVVMDPYSVEIYKAISS
jgi:glycosidase